MWYLAGFIVGVWVVYLILQIQDWYNGFGS